MFCDLALGLTIGSTVAGVDPPRLYIATTGSDETGDGSESNPLLNLNTAIDWADPYSTIVVADGTYTPTSLLDAYKSNITIRAAPGASPVFDAINYATPGDYNDRVIRIQNASNVAIIGIGFTRGPDGGMQLTGTLDRISIVKCKFFANGRTSLYEGEGFVCEGNVSQLLVEDCDSYENFDELGDVGQNADGFRISIYSGSATFRNCRAWRNSDDGFDAFNNSFDTGVSTVPVTFENCWSWENGILANGTDSLGDGMGFKLGGQRDVSNDSGGNTVTDCLSWGNRANGFTDNSATIANTVTHCTAYQVGGISFETNAAGTIVQNCISYDPGTADTNINGPAKVDHNSWQIAGVSVSDADFLSVDDTNSIGSRASDGTLPDSDFLVLDPASEMIRAGADGTRLGPV